MGYSCGYNESNPHNRVVLLQYQHRARIGYADYGRARVMPGHVGAIVGASDEPFRAAILTVQHPAHTETL